MKQNYEKECCPKFNPEPWNEKEINWDNKKFLKDKITSVFHIPLNFGSVMKKNMEKMIQCEACNENTLWLTDESKLFGTDLFISTEKEIPDTEIETISGAFLTKVFEGPYKDAGKWCAQMNEYVKSQGKEVKKLYHFYTTCPKCAKKYGKNYAVLFAKV
ncbi:MAG: hydrolase [Pseudomonadota bacterium]